MIALEVFGQTPAMVAVAQRVVGLAGSNARLIAAISRSWRSPA
ncbi:MAG: hypothetical protein ACLP8S_23185 [Solirubrobacteraceae bacterium]